MGDALRCLEKELKWRCPLGDAGFYQEKEAGKNGINKGIGGQCRHSGEILKCMG